MAEGRVLIFVLGYILVLLAMLSNEFAAPTVHMQPMPDMYWPMAGVPFGAPPNVSGFSVRCWQRALVGKLFLNICSMIVNIGNYIRIQTKKLFLLKTCQAMKTISRVKTRFLPLIY